MIYCEPCRVKAKWPKSLLQSRGACEVCNTSALCYDQPSSRLYPDERNVTQDIPRLGEAGPETVLPLNHRLLTAPKIKGGNPSIVIDPKRNPLDDMPTRTAYIVWNAARTEGYVTFDKQVAYEARKGAESNCFDENGTQMKLAQAFCEVYSSTEDAIAQVTTIYDPPEYPGDLLGKDWKPR